MYAAHMRFLSTILRRLNWRQLLLMVGLTTVAAFIILPYFFGGPACGAPTTPAMAGAATSAAPAMAQGVRATADCPSPLVRFYMLWFRLFVVAVVMLLSFMLADTFWRTRAKPLLALFPLQLLAVAVGAFVGTIISGLLIGRSLRQMFTVEPMFYGMVVFTAVGIGIGAVTAIVLVYRSRAARADAEAAKAEATRHELEKQVLAARLKLMQAQIEPHFLFNTLANVQHLTEANPVLAGKTLESLITYLRAALPQMRADDALLGRELAMAVAYLEIHAVRMGSRLAFSVDVPDGLAGEAFPPMMLLTLIENAIKHGIDPLPAGGHIYIRAAREGDVLVVSVADNGHGLSTSTGIGVGLANIRERLATLFGKRAKLLLEENSPTGVVAKITIAQT